MIDGKGAEGPAVLKCYAVVRRGQRQGTEDRGLNKEEELANQRRGESSELRKDGRQRPENGRRRAEDSSR